MNELPAIAAAARRLVDLGESGALLATLFGVRGSSYRPPGAMMLVTPAGQRVGGVSGGCLEDYVAREGRRLTEGGRPVVLSFDTARDAYGGTSPVPTPGCGGRLEVLVERLAPDHADLLDAVVAARGRESPAVLIHLLAPPAGGAGAGGAFAVRRVLFADGMTVYHAGTEDADASSLGGLGPAVLGLAGTVDTARPAFQGAVELGGRAWRALVQHVEPVMRLLVFGAGDDAQLLVRQAKLLGWHVSVFDRRGRLATAARFPEADVVCADDWDRLLPTVDPGPHAAAVVMTHSFADDAAVLARLSRCRPAYVGLLGPSSRRDDVLAEAASLAGAVPAAFADALRGPAGLDLGVKSPEAIALAVAAEILAVTRGRDAAPLSHKHLVASATNPSYPPAGDARRLAPRPCPTPSPSSSPPPARPVA